MMSARGRAGAEQPADAVLRQRVHVLGRDDAATRQQLVVDAALAHQLVHLGEQRHVRPRQDRQRDDVDVLLHRGFDDLLGGLVESRVDHFHARIAQRGRDDLGAAVVTVEPGLADEHSNLALHGVALQVEIVPTGSAGASLETRARSQRRSLTHCPSRGGSSSSSSSTASAASVSS
jgi:hypothetical protein